MRRLFEKKEDQIRKQTKLSDKEKNIIIKFFNLHPEQDKKCKEFGIDWNRHDNTADKFFNLIQAFNERFLPKLSLKDLKEGKDYNYLGRDDYYDYYFILSYRGSVTIASNNVAPEVWTTGYGRGYDTAISLDENSLKDYPTKVLEDGTILKGGAKWCTAYNHTSEHWDDYTDYSFFVYACAHNDSVKDKYKKVAIRYSLEDIDEDSYANLGGMHAYNLLCEMYDAPDYDFDSSEGYWGIIEDFLFEQEEKLRNSWNTFFNVKGEDKKRRKEEELKKRKKEDIRIFVERTQGREIKEFSYRGYDFPMVEMGTRPEGKVFGSYYLTADAVPFSPRYNCDKYEYGCNHWDISIARQWLNSDAPAGQWYKEQSVEGYKVDWDETSDYTKNFIKNTDGFLRIIGISKSQLNPVKNITYTTEGKEIITEDYIWIPSLTELSTQNNYKEGEPLDYWRQLLGDNASRNTNALRVMKSCDTLEPWWYWTRSAYSGCSDYVRCVGSDGYVYWGSADDRYRLPVLACFKSE